MQLLKIRSHPRFGLLRFAKRRSDEIMVEFVRRYDTLGLDFTAVKPVLKIRYK